MTTIPTGGGQRVAGKVALVTGAASGIGRAAAQLLAAHGAAVVCADLNAAGARATADAITAAACALDVTSEPAWVAAIDQVLAAHGRLDVLVNCAGISSASPLPETTLDEWHRVLAVNLDRVFLGTKHAVRVMRQTGTAGSVVNVSSVSGIKAQPGASAYCTSKAAILMLTRVAALECLHNGDKIRVNAVSPSGVKTPMWTTMPFFQELMAKEGGEEAAFAAMARASPYGRFALPEEVALAILYLASDESQYVTGTNLVFDQGDTA
jgi:NAD(P)-dependent dehydrogenase (short-subunit alcohol dehydrogenase family)